jgi:hypothetical protein
MVTIAFSACTSISRCLLPPASMFLDHRAHVPANGCRRRYKLAARGGNSHKPNHTHRSRHASLHQIKQSTLERYPPSPTARSEEECEDWEGLLGKEDAQG